MRPTVTTSETAGEGGIGVREAGVAAAAGLAGMAAMAPLLALGVLTGLLTPGAFAGLAEIVGLGPDLAIGLFIFVGGGLTTLPLLFVSLATFLPPARSVALRGATFAVVVWSGFAVAFYDGQTGLALAGFLALTLLAHVVYGYVLGAVYDRRAEIPDYVV
jgi:cytochrome c oxidase subunit 1